jgi:hypothetical protein
MMGITVEWDDVEHTIIRMTYAGSWTLEELRAKGMDAILMLRTVDHPVYVISDFTETANLPVGILWQARDLNRLRPANWAAGITVTNDGLARSLLELFGVIYLGQRRKQLFVAQTTEEAYETIHRLKSK